MEFSRIEGVCWVLERRKGMGLERVMRVIVILECVVWMWEDVVFVLVRLVLYCVVLGKLLIIFIVCLVFYYF